MGRRVVVGTRGSELALKQTGIVIRALEQQWPGCRFEVKRIKTTGDKIRDVALAKIGDKGLFTKELEIALLEGKIDLAVHSMKDLPTLLPEGLVVGAVLAREYPEDALISLSGTTLDSLPPGARVGTSSLRRQAQLRHYRPDLQVSPVRGNVNTRLSRLKKGDFDAVVLARAGLARLGLQDHVTQLLPYEVCLPAVGQGAIGIEIRAGDQEISDFVSVINDEKSRAEITAERAFMRRLEGGCQVPIGALARAAGAELTLAGVVADVDGERLFRAEETGPVAAAETVGVRLAEKLLAMGAAEILRSIRELS